MNLKTAPHLTPYQLEPQSADLLNDDVFVFVSQEDIEALISNETAPDPLAALTYLWVTPAIRVFKRFPKSRLKFLCIHIYKTS